jgi:NAD(P)-dependent dehydrogenase (short-subunit alcohol dehydrogenase family)
LDTPNYLSLLDLSGRNFVVLGAGQGIGAQACHALSQAGAKVICVDNDPDRAASISSAVNGHSVTADVTRREDMQRVFDEARRLAGPVTGIIDIVGEANTQRLASFDDDQWERQYAIVLRHVFLTLQIGAEAMAGTGGGSITFVGSIAGTASIPGQSVYGSAKAALHQLVRTMSHELAPRNIRVNAVAPGIVRTPRLESRLSAAQWEQVEQKIPLRKAAMPSQIASALLFLASDMASHVTGHILAADGGLAAITPLPPFAMPE